MMYLKVCTGGSKGAETGLKKGTDYRKHYPDHIEAYKKKPAEPVVGKVHRSTF